MLDELSEYLNSKNLIYFRTIIGGLQKDLRILKSDINRTEDVLKSMTSDLMKEKLQMVLYRFHGRVWWVCWNSHRSY